MKAVLYNEYKEDGNLITREEWLKLVRFNAYTPDDGDAYVSTGEYVYLDTSAFDGLPDHATHVYLVPK